MVAIFGRFAFGNTALINACRDKVTIMFVWAGISSEAFAWNTVSIIETDVIRTDKFGNL